MNANQEQIGGSHYKDMPIQPVEYIHRNGIPFIEGCVIKYVSRWRNKGGIEDIKKARHFIDLLIEMEGPQDTKGIAKPEPPWPARYEVGMKFRDAAGNVQTVTRKKTKGAKMNPNDWWYNHGEKFVAGFESKFPEDALIEYLGKE